MSAGHFHPYRSGSQYLFIFEILVAFIQAFIFANLSAVFIGQAIEEAHHPAEAHTAHHAGDYDDAVVL